MLFKRSIFTHSIISLPLHSSNPWNLDFTTLCWNVLLNVANILPFSSEMKNFFPLRECTIAAETICHPVSTPTSVIKIWVRDTFTTLLSNAMRPCYQVTVQETGTLVRLLISKQMAMFSFCLSTGWEAMQTRTTLGPEMDNWQIHSPVLDSFSLHMRKQWGDPK